MSSNKSKWLGVALAALVAVPALAADTNDMWLTTKAKIALLTTDVFVSMPPIPLEYRGIDAVMRLFAGIFGSGRRVDLVPTRANGQPAFGAYLGGDSGIRHGSGLFVLTLSGDRISAFTRFDSGVLPWFGLPRSLPPR